MLYARRGAFAAAATFLIAFLAALATINYYTLTERLILMIHDGLTPYSGGLALLLTYFLIFLLLQYLAMNYIEEHIDLNAIANSLAGGLFGCLAGLVLSGVLVVAWFMLPGTMYYRSSDTEDPVVIWKADEGLLGAVRFMANERIGGAAEGFDATHTFMRDRTNKFNPATGQTGLSESTFERDRARRLRGRGGGTRPNYRLLDDADSAE